MGTIVPPMPISHPAVKRQLDAEEAIARRGAEKAVDDLIRDRDMAADERDAAAEATMSTWAARDPVAAKRFVDERLAETGHLESAVEERVRQALLSGFVEGVVESNPDQAVAVSRWLASGKNSDPATTPLATNPGAAPGTARVEPGSDQLEFVWERGWTPPEDPPDDFDMGP